MSSQNYKDFFEEAIKQIREEMNANNQSDEFTLWFNMDYVEDTLSQITVSVSSEFMWIQMNSKKYVQRLEDKINELTGQQISITHIVKNKQTVSVPKKEPLPELETKPTTTEPEIVHQVEKKSGPTENSHKKHPQLNENFTFETFVPGENSIYAYNASISAAKNPGKAYNPILIYGGVGLGKTHLMQALGNFIYSNNEKSKIAYTSAENFTNEFTASLKNQTIYNFKKKYRSLDVLLLDDIQFLEGKEGTQEELFHTFNSIYDKNGQIVFTSDRPIKELKGFTERISSRFSRGLNVDLQPPNYENRLAIIQKKLELLHKSIPQDVIEYIAKNCQTNVRDIESCITKSIGFAELVGKPLTVEIAQNQLRDTINDPYSGTITIENIQKVVAEHYNVSVSDLKSKKKDRKFVIPRQISIFICCSLTEYSTTEIGNEFGGRDHTTIMHARDKVESLLKTDSSMNSTVNLLIRATKDFRK
ncbi:MAG: chromosomal replication initiator protein DnaA [Treponema sp.]|uniref:chromosomal replication initiator protein DnaA n=1 Tax=Treponema sp. TaxID=166 RepID=UPI00257DE05D|nr:chromosomal replication initiator protein DnaA [Treponema sp.]MBQ9101564.1 chromosomal replication initiator protein DnaA [Treponema sp.]